MEEMLKEEKFDFVMIKSADAFEFINPKTKEMKDYVGILNEFYGKKG